MRKSESRRRDAAAEVSHKLMTPITAIKGYAEALCCPAGLSPAQRLRFARIIEKNADRLTRFVEDRLALGFESGGRRTNARGILLRTLVCELVPGLLPVARRKAISISVEVPPGLAVRFDRVRLVQVLQELCGNALRYSRGKGRIVIAARVEGVSALVSVRDTGVGLAAEDPGLAVVKAVLSGQGCRVRAQSTEGKGSSFSFTLPLGV
ncbi:MAG TPA: hypothetical protein DEB40_13170 [Elusimicrobia bacterium]|nr:hypothetical protein [Elusimicrobiota bacterium]HBT62686.1 hypothetical protein [Elusimicrobiota bacterium]